MKFLIKIIPKELTLKKIAIKLNLTRYATIFRLFCTLDDCVEDTEKNSQFNQNRFEHR